MPKNIESLVSQGRLREAAAALDSLPTLSLSQRVTRAYIHADCDSFPGASAQATELLKSDLVQADRVRCLEIVGRASGHGGDLPQGVRLLEEAIRTAQGNAVLAARVENRLTGCLLVWIGIEPALARLPGLRRAVTAAADGYSTIALHLNCAHIQIKRYHRASAESHLATATELLKAYPHLIQEAKLLELHANHAALCSDYKKALELTRAALQKADKSGRNIAPLLANVGHFSLITGELSGVAECLAEMKTRFGTSGPHAVNAECTEFELALAEGNLDRAAELAASLQEISTKLESGYSYYGLWHLYVRTKWLIRTARHLEAAQVATSALPFAKRGADRYLYVLLRLRAAEACMRSGQSRKAVTLLTEVLNERDLPLEHLGDLSRTIAIVHSVHDFEGAVCRFARADRILSVSGLITASGELSRNREEVAANHDVAQTARASEVDTSEFAGSWLTIIDALSCPELVGHELLAIVRSTRCANAGALVAETREGKATVIASFDWDSNDNGSPRPDELMNIDIGDDGTRTWRLAVAPRTGPSGRLRIVEIDALYARLRRQTESETRDSLLGSMLVDETGADSCGMVIAAEATAELLTITRRVATSSVTVLFTGETGTGKELFARALHEASPRRDKPFIPFNCTAVARDMLDSQLFGYRRGAFTGAHDAFPGVIRAAAGGTLFLDEIGEISPEVQPKLLRFLESGEIHPLGEPKPVTVDVRIVAATNANLEQLVASGRFREDLFYRLNVVRLQVPPLRERREEIPPLVQHFLDKFSRESQKTGLRIADETLEYLILFKWPGNVRQLANEVRRLVALAESGAVLMPEHLSPEIAASRKTVPASTRDIAPTEFVVRVDQPISAAFEHLERAMIKYALEIAGDRLEDAAQMLGLSRKGLYLKRQRLKMAESSLRDDGADEAAS